MGEDITDNQKQTEPEVARYEISKLNRWIVGRYYVFQAPIVKAWRVEALCSRELTLAMNSPGPKGFLRQ